MASDVHDVVDSPWQLRVSQHEEFLKGVAMGVVDPGNFGSDDFIHFPPDGLDEGWALDRGVDGDITLGFYRVVDIDADHILGPFFKFGHFLTRELIAIARDVDSAVVINNKLSILIAPPGDLKPLFFVANGLASLDFKLGQINLKILKSFHNKNN